MNRRRRYTIIISLFVISTVIILFRYGRNDHSVSFDEYVYDVVDPSCNYSEKNVLYIGDAGVLHLIDTESCSDIVYCDKPNCTHEGYSHSNENPTCPAVFYGLYKSGTVLYNSHLFFLGNMSDEDFLTQYLYEMDQNGENRKKVATLQEVQNIRYVLYRDNYVIGGYTNRVVLNDDGQIINDNKPETGIFIIDLETYEVQKSPMLTGEQINITGMYYENGVVYYSVARFNEDVSDAMLADASESDFEDFILNNLMHDFYQYDIKNKDNTLVNEIGHIYNMDFLDGNAYCTSKDGYYVFDVRSGKTVNLDIVNSVAPEDKSRFRGFTRNGDDLYFCYLDEDEKVVYCLLRGTNLTEIMRLSKEEAYGIVCICGSSVYINYYVNGEFSLGVMNIDDLNKGIYNPHRLRNYNEEG